MRVNNCKDTSSFVIVTVLSSHTQVLGAGSVKCPIFPWKDSRRLVGVLLAPSLSLLTQQAAIWPNAVANKARRNRQNNFSVPTAIAASKKISPPLENKL